MHTRHCVPCDEEFRPEIVYCSDCGGLLEDRWERVGAQTAEPDSPPEPDEPTTKVVHLAGSMEASRAARALFRNRIRFWVVSATGGFDVLVRTAEESVAIAVLEGHAAALALAQGSDSALADGRCPACDHRVAKGTVHCPECELVIGDDHSFCERCSHELEPDDDRCRECGTPRAIG